MLHLNPKCTFKYEGYLSVGAANLRSLRQPMPALRDVMSSAGEFPRLRGSAHRSVVVDVEFHTIQKLF
jgi:hypothetical protein